MKPSLLLALAWVGAAGLAGAARLPDHLDEDTCTRYYINNVPDDPLLEKEHCTLCQLITENAEKWDYVNDLASLCSGVPPHAMDWCVHYACRLRFQCPYFFTRSCKVMQSNGLRNIPADKAALEAPDSFNFLTLSPCPAKYMCSYCLNIPRTQVFGCFDGLL